MRKQAKPADLVRAMLSLDVIEGIATLLLCSVWALVCFEDAWGISGLGVGYLIGISTFCVSAAGLLMGVWGRIVWQFRSSYILEYFRLTQLRSIELALVFCAGVGLAFGWPVWITVSLGAAAILSVLCQQLMFHSAWRGSLDAGVLPAAAIELAAELGFKTRNFIAGDLLYTPARIVLTLRGYFILIDLRLWRALDSDQQLAVIAHELAHYKHRAIIADITVEIVRDILSTLVIYFTITAAADSASMQLAIAVIALLAWQLFSEVLAGWLENMGERAADNFAANRCGLASIDIARAKVRSLLNDS